MSFELGTYITDYNGFNFLLTVVIGPLPVIPVLNELPNSADLCLLTVLIKECEPLTIIL